MNFLSIVFFLITGWGFGFTLTSFVNESKNLIERNIMRLGIGLALFSVLSLIINQLRIPLNWWLFLLLSLIAPLIYLFKNGFNLEYFNKLNNKKVLLSKKNIFFVILLILFAFNMFMYLNGSFGYKHFEDGDPWNHGAGAKYISIFKTAYEPIETEELLLYLDPYPPAYEIFMGMNYQISGDIVWTLKFFNSFIICLGIVFFYFFAKRLMKDEKKALLSTFILSMIPCYMSHFIWAHTLVVMLLFPLLYSMEMLNKDKKWWIIISICFASLYAAQPSQAFKMSIIFAIYYLVKLVLDRKYVLELTFAGISAIIIALIMWWGRIFLKTGSVLNSLNTLNGGWSNNDTLKSVWYHIYKQPGSADRIYTFSDFFIAKSQNMINNPIGVGWVLMILLFISLFFIIIKYKDLLKKENNWMIISLLWFLYTLLGVHGARNWMPVQLIAFRFWMLFAIFFSIVVSMGIFYFFDFVKRKNFSLFLLILLIIMGVWFTSGTQKYTVNTVTWYPSAEFMDHGQFESWENIRELPKDTAVFYPCADSWILNLAILAYDKYTCVWCEDELEFRQNVSSRNGTEIYNFAKSKDYDYLYIDGKCISDLDNNATKLNEILMELSEVSRLSHKSKGGFLWQLK